MEDDEDDFIDEVSRSWPADPSFCLQLLTRCLGKQYKKLIAKLEALIMRANTLYKVGEYCSAYIILRVMSEEVDEVTSQEIRFRIFTINSPYLEQNSNQWHLWGQRWYGPTWLRAWGSLRSSPPSERGHERRGDKLLQRSIVHVRWIRLPCIHETYS